MLASISRIDGPTSTLAGGIWFRGLLLVGFVALPWLDPSELSAEGFGPFPVRNFNPLQQLVLNMPGDRAAVVRKGTLDVRLELANTAAIYNQNAPSGSATVKFETLRNGLSLRYGLTDRLETFIEVPVLYRYEGVMEGMISAVERATTGLSPARAALSQVNYIYNVTRGGRQIVNGTEGAVGLGDTTLSAKYQFLAETSSLPALSIRTALKVPTGDEAEFFGSGSPDFGIGFAGEKSIGGRWILYANLNGVFPTGRIAGLPLQPTFSSLTAAEYLWSEHLSLTLQFEYYTTPFHGTGLEIFDKGVSEVTGGFSYLVTRRWLWQVYGVENVDFITGSAADFTLSTLFTYRFGA